MKVAILHDGITDFLAVRLFDGESIYMDASQPVRVVKTKVVRDND